jgi:uncharacterized Zn finger protein
MWYSFRPYVSVAQRRANAARQLAKLTKKGLKAAPVRTEGRMLASTFWGKAWCENLESYSDFENRLPRGRTYVRNGSVVHLEIEPGKVTALVSGSELYKVKISIRPLAERHWTETKSRCAGRIGSLVELLQGRLSKAVMDIVTSPEGGLFPKPKEIEMDCSCPDWAGMCKHIAAVLYGVGTRLDEQPELLFVLRKVDHLELIEEALPQTDLQQASSTGKKTLAQSEVAGVFGIELAETGTADTAGVLESSGSKAKARVVRPAARQSAKKRRKVKSKQSSKAAMVAMPARTATAEHQPKARKPRGRMTGKLGRARRAELSGSRAK